jgi:hypothetical protein
LANREADLFGRLDIDYELGFRRLLDGKIGRLGTLKILSTMTAARL